MKRLTHLWELEQIGVVTAGGHLLTVSECLSVEPWPYDGPALWDNMNEAKDAMEECETGLEDGQQLCKVKLTITPIE